MNAVELVEAFVSALNQADWHTAETLVSADIAFDDEEGQRHIGRGDFHVAWTSRRSEGETMTDTVTMTNAEGSRAAAEFTMRGRRRDGERDDFSVPAGAFFEIEDGRIARFSLRIDPVSLQRMGARAPVRP